MPAWLAARRGPVLELEKATGLPAVLDIRDRAEALRHLLETSRQGLELQNQAADLRIRAERKAGRMLREMKRQQRGRPRKGNTMLPLLRLSDLGISKIEVQEPRSGLDGRRLVVEVVPVAGSGAKRLTISLKAP